MYVSKEAVPKKEAAFFFLDAPIFELAARLRESVQTILHYFEKNIEKM